MVKPVLELPGKESRQARPGRGREVTGAVLPFALSQDIKAATPNLREEGRR